MNPGESTESWYLECRGEFSEISPGSHGIVTVRGEISRMKTWRKRQENAATPFLLSWLAHREACRSAERSRFVRRQWFARRAVIDTAEAERARLTGARLEVWDDELLGWRALTHSDGPCDELNRYRLR
jgi:hypothetical protein